MFKSKILFIADIRLSPHYAVTLLRNNLSMEKDELGKTMPSGAEEVAQSVQ